MNMFLHASFSADMLPGTDEEPSTTVAIAWKDYVEAIRQGLIDEGPGGWNSFLCGWIWMEWFDPEEEGEPPRGGRARGRNRGATRDAARLAPGAKTPSRSKNCVESCQNPAKRTGNGADRDENVHSLRDDLHWPRDDLH